MKIKTLLESLLSLFYPRLCVVCRDVLREGEDYFCLHCLFRLPVTKHYLCPENSMTNQLAGKILFEKACGFLFYYKGGMARSVVSEIKYKGNQGLGRWMGKYASGMMLESGFFNTIDLIVPVPLHKKKRRQRTFNQAEIFAQGVSESTGIMLDSSTLYRQISNVTQTKKGSFERWLNTRNIFALNNPEIFAGKHILLVDDVFTTGSTIEACAEAITKACPDVKVSILTLAIA